VCARYTAAKSSYRLTYELTSYQLSAVGAAMQQRKASKGGVKGGVRGVAPTCKVVPGGMLRGDSHDDSIGEPRRKAQPSPLDDWRCHGRRHEGSPRYNENYTSAVEGGVRGVGVGVSGVCMHEAQDGIEMGEGSRSRTTRHELRGSDEAWLAARRESNERWLAHSRRDSDDLDAPCARPSQRYGVLDGVQQQQRARLVVAESGSSRGSSPVGSPQSSPSRAGSQAGSRLPRLKPGQRAMRAYRHLAQNPLGQGHLKLEPAPASEMELWDI
jgi:hypothetical protein